MVPMPSPEGTSAFPWPVGAKALPWLSGSTGERVSSGPCGYWVAVLDDDLPTQAARPGDRLRRHEWDHKVADSRCQGLPGQDVARLDRRNRGVGSPVRLGVGP